jgi:hypothetical protein
MQALNHHTTLSGLVRSGSAIVLFLLLLTTSSSGAPTVVENSPFGIEINGAHETVEFNKATQAGAHFVRLAGLWWPDVEATEGLYNWSGMDWLVSRLSAAANRNMTVVLVVRGTPAWAQARAGVACGPIRSDKLNAFATFMYDLVTRYGVGHTSIKYWELGNEPDIDPKLVEPDSLTGCWGNDQDDYYGGAEYARMLEAVYPRIKEADPTAQVLLGGLVLDCDPRPNMGCKDVEHAKPSRFLEGVLKSGGASFFDGVSFHSYDYYDGQLGKYSNSNWQSDSVSTGPVSLAKAAYLRSLFKQYGVRDKALLNTESALLCWKCTIDSTFEMTKALYAATVNVAALHAGLSANIWFRMADWSDTELLAPDLTAKPALTAFGTSTQALRGAQYERDLFPVELGNNRLRGAVFNRYGEKMWLVWSIDEAPQTLTLAKFPQSVRGLFGQTIAVKSQGIELDTPERMFLYITPQTQKDKP